MYSCTFCSSDNCPQIMRVFDFIKNQNKRIFTTLLCREEIRDELRRLSDVFNESVAYTASAGLKKLAMGSVADAVSLLYKEKPDHDVLEKMDLFLVSEIKRKDNCVEIKFFDRFKALCELMKLSGNDTRASSFYDALMMGAESLNRDGD